MVVTCHVCHKTFTKKLSEIPKSKKNYCSRRCFFDLNQRFFDRLDATGDCWTISGSHTGFGYGLIGKNLAHRFAWELFQGPIPDRLWVLHRCDNPKCVNPSHLFLGTPTDNQQDASKKGRLCRGEAQSKAKLTEDQILKIRERYSHGERGSKLAAEFCVSGTTISRIIRGKAWKYLNTDYPTPPKRPTNPVLSVEQVSQIRKIGRSENQMKIALRFGITQGAVSRILNRKSWC